MPEFTEDRQPEKRRGRSTKNKILDAIKSESVKDLIGLHGEPTREQAENAFFSHIAKRAF